MQVPACLEILYEQITGEKTVIIVYCQSNKDRQVKAINTTFTQFAVRKCCSHSSIFDSRTKACVPWLNESESLLTFLSNGSVDVDLVVIANEGPPTCKGPIVDYEIDEDDIFLRNGTYSVSEADKTFKIVSKLFTVACPFIHKQLSLLLHRDLIFSSEQIMFNYKKNLQII